jgi:hypothetical protein
MTRSLSQKDNCTSGESCVPFRNFGLVCNLQEVLVRVVCSLWVNEIRRASAKLQRDDPLFQSKTWVDPFSRSVLMGIWGTRYGSWRRWRSFSRFLTMLPSICFDKSNTRSIASRYNNERIRPSSACMLGRYASRNGRADLVPWTFFVQAKFPSRLSAGWSH